MEWSSVKDKPPKLNQKGKLYSPLFQHAVNVEVCLCPHAEGENMDKLFWNFINPRNNCETWRIIMPEDIWSMDK